MPQNLLCYLICFWPLYILLYIEYYDLIVICLIFIVVLNNYVLICVINTILAQRNENVQQNANIFAVKAHEKCHISLCLKFLYTWLPFQGCRIHLSKTLTLVNEIITIKVEEK